MFPWRIGKKEVIKRYFLKELINDLLSDNIFNPMNIYLVHTMYQVSLLLGKTAKWCQSFPICHIREMMILPTVNRNVHLIFKHWNVVLLWLNPNVINCLENIYCWLPKEGIFKCNFKPFKLASKLNVKVNRICIYEDSYA